MVSDNPQGPHFRDEQHCRGTSYARCITAWKLCTTMKAEDVTATLEMALDAAGLDRTRVFHRPRLLSDNGSSYISDDLAKWLDANDMDHVRGAPYHPMTQGKIER
jgi:putative transposase